MAEEEAVPYDKDRHGPVPQRFINGCKGDLIEV